MTPCIASLPTKFQDILPSEVIEEFQLTPWHNNKLLMYNGGIPKTRINNPNATIFGSIIEHTL